MRIRLRAVVLEVAALVATLALGAAPASAHATATIPMPGWVTETVGVDGAVYALSEEPPAVGPETPVLVRIDPDTNTVTGSLDLPGGLATGNMLNTSALAVADGSIWVVSYFHDQVLRIDPDAMAIVATIGLGRSPASIVYANHVLWVPLENDRSVARIDPVHNTRLPRIRVGRRDGSDHPGQAAFDGRDVLVALPGSGRVARIDASTGAVHYDRVGPDAGACAHLLPVRGGYWLDDTECSFSYYRWDAATKQIAATVTPPNGDFGAVIHAHALYTGEFVCDDTGTCTQGFIVKRDELTGVQTAKRAVGVEALFPHFAAGSFWVTDTDNITLQRVSAF